VQSVSKDILDEAIASLGTEGVGDDEVESQVSSLVGDPMTARRLIDWPPEAFGLVFISHEWNIKVPKMFSARSADGEWHEFGFNNEPMFTESLKIAQRMFHSGPRNVFKNVSLRSSMIAVVNKALNSGASLDGASIGGPALVGIPAELYQSPSKSFWRRIFS
jgi:hypothetical protein